MANVIQSDIMADTMSSKAAVRPIAAMHSEATQQLILEAAFESLVHGGEITARGAAAQARISERTVFRYFPTRDGLLSACAAYFAQRVRLPAPPSTLDELRAFPRALFTAFESHRELVRASWHSELRSHLIARASADRWVAIGKLIDAFAPHAPASRRKLATASIRYHLTASTWHYLRFVLRLTSGEAVECVEQVIALQLAALMRKPRGTRSSPTSPVAKR